jgi:hypothetical protein
MRLRNFSLGAAVLLISTGLGQSVNATIPASESEQAPSITSCIAKNRKLDALMVVDESVSLIRTKGPGGKLLPGTDMNDDRVTALKAVTQVLLDKVKDSDPDRRTKVSVALAGFGNGYTEHQSWMDLTTGTASKFLEVIDEQASRETSQYTRYHLALKGALATFSEKENKDGATCRMLIWFSDGQHDDNDSGKVMSSTEESQVRKTICGSNGSADQLRLQGVYTVAAGLNENKSSLGLMKLVSQGDGDIKLKNEVLSSCGEVKPEGRFAVASGAGDLVETLVTLIEPDIGNPDLQPCEDGLEECSQISFVVNSQVSRFTLFVDRGDDEVQATLESEQTGETELFGKVVDRNIEQTLLSENGAYVRVTRKQDGLINGRWTLKFRGENHAQGRALVRFVGEASVKLMSVQSDGKIGSAKSVDRFETKPLRVGVTAKTGGAVLDGARLEFKTRDGLIELNSYTEDGKLLVPAEELQRVLKQNPQLKDALEAELVVTPLGSVEGITDPKTGKNMPIDFGSFPFKLRITNGSGFPEYLGLDRSIEGVDATGHPIFKGTNKKTVGFKFKGASASDSVVTFDTELKSDIGLKFISGQKCEVKKAVETTCILEMKPSKESNGSHPAAAKITSSVKGSSETQIGEIPLDLETLLPNDKWRGLKAALILIASFLAIQAAQRFFFAALISRYGALNPTARRARIDIRVSNTGDITGEGGSRLAVKNGDEAFVFENTDTTTQFPLFGYQFSCSAWETFKRSTSVPLGSVSKGGYFTFGSAGVQTPKKSQILEEGTKGLVELSLRGQWIIGIANSDFVSLTQGTSQVAAELVVYLSPFDQVSLEQQLGEISFTISAGRFPALLNEVILEVQNALEKSLDVEADVIDPGNWQDPLSNGQSTNLLDPFALPAESATTSDTGDRSNRSIFPKIFSRGSNRKSKQSDAGSVDEPPSSSSSYLDPFSN